jgi:hypothetical protein
MRHLASPAQDENGRFLGKSWFSRFGPGLPLPPAQYDRLVAAIAKVDTAASGRARAFDTARVIDKDILRLYSPVPRVQRRRAM